VIERLAVRRWPDPVLDTIGHDPRGWYVEAFWLPVVGPTAVALLRRLVDGLERHPDGFEIPYVELATSLGLGERPPSNSAPLTRALRRLHSFRFVQLDEGARSLDVRMHVPVMHRKHVRRLPDVVRAAHHEWAEAQLTRPLDELQQARARRLALCLLEQGDDPDCAERALARIGFATRLARESVMWARDRHLLAARAVGGLPA
jgi:hypothetical protein